MKRLNLLTSKRNVARGKMQILCAVNLFLNACKPKTKPNQADNLHQNQQKKKTRIETALISSEECVKKMSN